LGDSVCAMFVDLSGAKRSPVTSSSMRKN
jgi:hypothetical protein